MGAETRVGRPRKIAGILSDAEQQVADLVVLGLTNKEVGAKLCIEEGTVKFHLTNIYYVKNCKCRSDFIVKHYQNIILGLTNLVHEITVEPEKPAIDKNKLPIGEANVNGAMHDYGWDRLRKQLPMGK